MTNIAKRSEFLFVYDTKLANPNGDPDENRPRIDPYSGKNLVTEYRLKRTVRDYLQNQGELIFIREDLNSDGSRKTIEELAKPYIKIGKEDKSVNKTKLINEHIDVRLFGLLFAVGGITFKNIGPVQFSIGQSLNKVQEILIRNTRVVPTKEDAKSGTFGEKTVLKYSLISFHGFLNQVAALENNLVEKDVEKMILAMWHGTNNLITSSKFGQISRLLLRIIYNEDTGYIGDIENGLSVGKNENIENISDAKLDISKLLSKIEHNKNLIEEIQFCCNDNVSLSDGSDLKSTLLKWFQKHQIKHKDLCSSK